MGLLPVLFRRSAILHGRPSPCRPSVSTFLVDHRHIVAFQPHLLAQARAVLRTRRHRDVQVNAINGLVVDDEVEEITSILNSISKVLPSLVREYDLYVLCK